MNNLSTKILEVLYEYKQLPTSELAARVGVDKKRIWYEINLLNQEISMLTNTEIIYDEGMIVLPQEVIESRTIISESMKMDYQIPREYRQSLLNIVIATETDWIGVDYLEIVLNLSRNSVLNELKIMKLKLNEVGLSLKYSRTLGYEIVGDEFSIRKVIEKSLSYILEFESADMLLEIIYSNVRYKLKCNQVVNEVSILSKEFNVSFVIERYYEFIHLCVFIGNREQYSVSYAEIDRGYFTAQPIYQMSMKLCNRLNYQSESTELYLTTRLLGAIQGGETIVNDESLVELTQEIIQRVNVLTSGALGDSVGGSLQHTLYEHLVPSYFRLKYDIPLSNPYTEKIINDYYDLYVLVSKALQPLEQKVGRTIPDSELAYFTIHFGGHIRNYTDDSRQLKAITICPNGISTSLILQAQLEALFPTIEFVGIYKHDGVNQLDPSMFDMIFSTIPLNDKHEVFVTKPIMNWVEQELLTKKVNKVFNIKNNQLQYQLDSLIQAISKSAEIHDQDALIEDLAKVLYQKKFEQEGNELKDLLKSSFIQFTDDSMNWEEAIAFASEPLLKEGYIKESYIEAMISKVKEIGPYIVLAPKVAIPHARPEDGSVKMGISLLKSEHPISFNFESDVEDKDVQLIFVLSAIDSSSHLTALQQLSYLLEEEDNIDKMLEINDKEDLYEFILENSKEN